VCRAAIPLDRGHVLLLANVDADCSESLFAEVVEKARGIAAHPLPDETPMATAQRIMVKVLPATGCGLHVCNREISILPDGWKLIVMEAFADWSRQNRSRQTCLVRSQQLAS
jgi:hypothetical protein